MRQSRYDTQLDDLPRIRPAGPAAMFGRGRALLAALMGILAAVAYFSGTGFRSDGNESGATRAVVPDDLSPNEETSATNEAFRLWAAENRGSVERLHGGLVQDRRSDILQTVGDRILRSVGNELPAGLRFELLSDTGRATTYAFDDGTIMITLGMAQLARIDGEVAATLCDQLERFVRARQNVPRDLAFGDLSRRWMERSGYDPANLDVVRRRLASLLRRAG